MERTLQKLINTFKGLSTFKKVLYGIFFFVAILFVGLLVLFFGNRYNMPEAPPARHAAARAKELEDTIRVRKKRIKRLLDDADQIDKNTLKNRERVKKAKSMRELDDLQKELDL